MNDLRIPRWLVAALAVVILSLPTVEAAGVFDPGNYRLDGGLVVHRHTATYRTFVDPLDDYPGSVPRPSTRARTGTSR